MTIRTALAAAAALALAGVGLAAGTTAAAAHDATASLDCEGWSASASAYPADAHGTVIADGVTIHDGTFGGAGTLSGAWPAVAPTHRLQVTITSPDGWPDFLVDRTVEGCAPVEPEPEPVDPGPQPPADEASSVSEWRDTGVIECGDTTVEQTRLVTVTSTPYALVDGAWVPDYSATVIVSESTERQQRELAADEVIECPVVTPPVVEPPVVEPPVEPTPEVTPPVVETPEVVAPEPTPVAVPAVAVSDAPATLPETGSEVPTGLLVMLAIGLLGVGVTVVAVVRS